MSTLGAHSDPAVAVARKREDVTVGDEIVRHRLSTRVVHWAVALTFFVCLFTGLPIWSPLFGWMAQVFGGLTVCRWLHPWTGLAYFAATLALFAQWRRDMAFEPGEKGWLGPKLIRYMRYESLGEDSGKYNGGQKLLFWAVLLAALGLLSTGVVMWFPLTFAPALHMVAAVLHDVTFVLLAVAIVFHIYIGTAAEPGTFGSMTRGTVTRSWARLHHPRWYREVTDDPSRPQ